MLSVTKQEIEPTCTQSQPVKFFPTATINGTNPYLNDRCRQKRWIKLNHPSGQIEHVYIPSCVFVTCLILCIMFDEYCCLFIKVFNEVLQESRLYLVRKLQPIIN